MGQPRRLPAWLLIVATGVVCAGAFALEYADPFPLSRLAVRWSPSAPASTQAVPEAEIVSGVPILALSLDHSALYGATGILDNKLRHGAEWEREGSVAYYEGGRLRFASGVGVRIHGGGSRYTSPRQGFRLYFRRRYGPREFTPGILFSPRAQPIRRLIVHNDVRPDFDKTPWNFVNPLAYDIAREMGAIAAETKPVRFYLNGEYYGPFVLTERFDERYFAAHWGYDDILLSQETFDELWAWVQRTRPLTLEKVSRQVDLENLTRWFLATAFCATGDAYQGPGQFLDLTRPQGGWFWVNWDMDQAFRTWNQDSYQTLLERIAERRRGRNRAEPRSVLLTRLLSQDPEYRAFFKRIFLQVMNHRVTDAFLAERYEHYLDVGEQLRVENLDYLPRLHEFLERRPAFFRLITEQWLNSPPSQPVTLIAPEGVPLLIDGEQVQTGYRGLYFPDLEVSVDVPADYRARLTGWRVNGRAAPGGDRVTFFADRPTRVEAVFENSAAAMPSDVEAPQEVKQSAAPEVPVRWKTIPAGTFWLGCVPGDEACDGGELPRTQVHIDKPFEIMEHEVSAGEFQRFAAGQMPRQPEWYADATHPVVNVTWDEAQAYCEWTGGHLPTEEEWEYAARGGLDGRLFPTGDEPPADVSRTAKRLWPRTAPVGASTSPNGFGVYDLAGNVWEWTASQHRPTHDTAPPNDGYELRTIKGGSWDSSPARRRVSGRAALARHGRHNLYVGFRCLRRLPPAAP
jgi:formylglycine-generating enzyme required for sulfatase activity